MDKQEGQDKWEVDPTSMPLKLKRLTLAGWLLTLLSVTTTAILCFYAAIWHSDLGLDPRKMGRKWFAFVVAMIGVIPGMIIF